VPQLAGRGRRLAGVAALLLSVLVACQPVATVPKPARGGTAVEALVGPAGPLNPLFETNDTTRDVDSVIYQGLTTVDANQNVIGLLASDWAISPDHLTYSFKMRAGVKWADGQPFGADDVLFTFHVLQDLEYLQPGAEFWREVGVAAAGTDQVVFTLRSPSASFPLALRIGIIAKHLFAGLAPAQIAASPNSGIRAFGTGPFRVAAIDASAVTLDRNQYANPQPYLDHLVMRTYGNPQEALLSVEHGTTDLVGGLDPNEVAALQGTQGANVTVQDARTYTNAFIALNSEGSGKPFFSDVKVRQALVRAVDRQRLISEVLGGRGDADPTPIPRDDWAFSASAANKYPLDQLAASKALDAAGWTLPSGSQVRSKDGQPFQVTLVVADSYPNRQIAEAVVTQLSGIGVRVVVKPVGATDLVENYLLGRKYQMALVVFDVSPDPDLYSLWHSGADTGSLNFAYTHGWGLIDKDLEDGRATVDPPARLAAYSDFQALIADQAPAIFLYSAHYDYAVASRVRGVRLNRVIEPEDRFQYVTEWYVNTGAGG
jgi:peptide/nickel transport system substrate-binding protein